MSLGADFLYDLLPAFVRNRDFYQGQPLRALMEALESEYGRTWEATAALYEDWFIETCSEGAVPAIGDLLALDGDGGAGAFHLRALVGNAIACRRRKGVPAALERVIRDATGWYARVVELSRLVVGSQSLAAPRHGGGTVDLRDEMALATLGTAFDAVPRLDAVRRAGRPAGDPAPARPLGPGFNLADLGIFVWRLQAYPLSGAGARPAAPGCYRFHPLGVDTPLFNQPRTGAGPTEAAALDNLPVALAPEVLTEEIAALRRGEERLEGVFGQQPVLRVTDPETGEPIPFEAMEIADLGSWQRPAAGACYMAGPPGEERELPIRVAIDPARGRLAFPLGRGERGEVEVSFSYGFPSDLGGGPYPGGGRPHSGAAPLGEEVEWRMHAGAGGDFRTLEEALVAWNGSSAASGAVWLTAGGSSTLPAEPPEIDLRRGRRLAIACAGTGPGVVLGDLRAIADDGACGSKLALAGLWLGGRLEATGDLELSLSHCTLAPQAAASPGGPPPSLLLHGPAAAVTLADSIVGPIETGAADVRLQIAGCILDGAGGPAVAAGGRLVLRAARSTVLGAVECTRIDLADAVLFDGPVTVADVAAGELRYCWVSPGSETPYRFRCQPSPATGGGAAGAAAGWPVPVFVSKRYGAPGYAQLDPRSPRGVRAGGESGSEIGVYELLYQPQREAALAAVLAEYLPWGLEPRVVYVT